MVFFVDGPQDHQSGQSDLQYQNGGQRGSQYRVPSNYSWPDKDRDEEGGKGGGHDGGNTTFTRCPDDKVSSADLGLPGWGRGAGGRWGGVG